MKTVIDIYKVKEVEVPDNYIQCSHCDKWEDPSSYTKREDKKQDRTNCYTCYMVPMEDWKVINKKRDDIKRSVVYKDLIKSISERKQDARAMKISDLIKELEDLKNKHGDIPIYRTVNENECCSGYDYEEPMEKGESWVSQGKRVLI